MSPEEYPIHQTATATEPVIPMASDLGVAPHDQLPLPKSSIGREAHSFIGALFSWLIIPLGIIILIHLFVLQPYHVVGSSMVPSLREPDYLIISKLGQTRATILRAFGNDQAYIPKRGEIIVFHFPKDPKEVFVKRVVGIPGDHVVIKDGRVAVYNSAWPKGINPDDTYEPSGTTTQIDTDVIVPAGNVFVMGDNRLPSQSFDSREWGELPSSYIIGNAVMRLLPLDQIKSLP
jgi:signal peptidase I